VEFLSSAAPWLVWLVEIGIPILCLLVVYLLIKRSSVLVYIKSDEFGVIEKMFSFKGSNAFISLDGRAGFQPEVIRTGAHFFIPFMYLVHKQKLITVRSIAYVYSRIGTQLPAGQTLAKTPKGINFEDVRLFLNTEGQRGPQRTIIREGIYAFNTAAFVIFTENAIHTIDVGDDKMTLESIRTVISDRKGFRPVVLREQEDLAGIVTIHDGPTLGANDIIAPRVGVDDVSSPLFHNSFQDPEAFLNAGGRRGRQDQVITEGTYFMNRLFATVEFVKKRIVPVGEVGVVISYTGSVGEDVSGPDYRHGTLVAKGHRGVQEVAWSPGKYAINPFAMDIEPVPTTNFVLRWMMGRQEDHGFDSGLTEIPLITRDAFQPMLPLSVVVHIAPEKASRVIQRFAKIKLLVDQTLDPIVSAFFKDAAQNCTMIELINKRKELQDTALRDMRVRFAAYDLDLEEVMIGTPKALDGDTSIPKLLDQLRFRQTAEEQKITYLTQQEAQTAFRGLNEATATAEAQLALTKSKIDIEIARQRGEADAIEKRGIAQGIIATGNANATVITATGKAEAEAIAAKVSAFTGEGAEKQLQQAIASILADAIRNSPHPIVPNIVVQSGDKSGAGPMDALLAIALGQQSHTPSRRA